MSRLQRIILACALTLFAACDGEDTAENDPNAPAAPGGSGGDDGKGGPIPLNLWVDSMIDSGESAEPDTVQDKNISDDENDAPYSKYFEK